MSQGCGAASTEHPRVGIGGEGGTSTGEGGSTASIGGGAIDGSGGAGVGGAGLASTTGGGEGGGGGAIMKRCGSQCGPTELCDDDHRGLDDDCNDLVDEGCQCIPGTAHWCFAGDPSYHDAPGCFDGTMKCTDLGQWGPCVGGKHVSDFCFANDQTLCHPLLAAPFETANLKTGTGQFSIDAVTEQWTVACPPGVVPCPAVSGANPADDFKAVQSGQYDVTYTKTIAGGGSAACTYPLFVGAPGLRIELQWEHDLGGTGVDLDLHVHQPTTNAQVDPLPWSTSGAAQDCTWSNCVAYDFQPPQAFNAPKWFFDVGVPPTPLNWYLDPILAKNTCYSGPTQGSAWQSIGLGCHNPRLDTDDITCDPAVTNSSDYDFCLPENVNVDFPPDGEWFRIGVHYYSNHGLEYDVHPNVKVYCDGALAADLGNTGYYLPEQPVTFTASDGGQAFGGNRFWLVADVAFKTNFCDRSCVVQPLYADENDATPLLILDTGAESSFGPPVPPPP